MSRADSDADQLIHCGYAHHFVGAESCRFHLATFVGRWLVSTVGDYRPDGWEHPMQALGMGDSFYETMVFPCDPDDRDDEGEPRVSSWGEAGCERYATAREANEGHARLCREFTTR